MAKIKINNLNPENQMVELDEKQLSNVLGGKQTTWHIYYAPNGNIIRSVWVDDGQNTSVDHFPTAS